MTDTAMTKKAVTPISWNEFTRSNKVALAAIQQTDAAEKEKQAKKAADEPYGTVLKDFLDYLARDVGFVPDRPLSKDIHSLRAAITSIIEAENEDILTEEECVTVLQFIVSSFVERRFDRIFKHMLPHSESKQWYYTS